MRNFLAGAIIGLLLLTVLLIEVYQNSVIIQQQTIMRIMTSDPACMGVR